MPRYWLTQHWPHPANASEDHPWSVYLQQRYRSKGANIAPGDRIVFYETGGSGKATYRPGTQELVKLTKGRQAVVGVAEAAERIRPRNIGVSQYADGSQLNWAWEVPCRSHEWGRQTVRYEDVLEILGRGSIRIPGGLIEITEAEYNELRRRMGL